MASKLFEVTERIVDGVVVIKITEGKFKGIEFTFGGIAVSENNGEATLKFEYNIVSGSELLNDIDAFRQVSGDILMDVLDEQLNKNEVIYHGGVDA